MKPLKESISLSLDPDVIKSLRDLAEEDDRSLSQFINIILRQWLQSGNTTLFPDPPASADSQGSPKSHSLPSRKSRVPKNRK